MSEEIIEKKVVNRNVAIALGIMCIILVASVAGLLVVVSERDSTIQTNNGQIDSLNYEVIGLNNIINMRCSEVVFAQNVSVNPLDESIVSLPQNCSGYIRVDMTCSKGFNNLTSTWIELFWDFGSDISYAESRHLSGTYDTEYFPIVGCPSFAGVPGYIQLNNDRNETVTEFMTVTYYY